MEDDDWMFPRHLPAADAKTSDERPEIKKLKIDPKLLQRRRLRKQKLSPQPTGTTAEEPWSDFDRSVARSAPAFPDRMWTLGDAARWVIERTPQAVDGLSIDEEKLFEILPEIHATLSAGEVSVFANTNNDPVPRELPAETWSVYELVVEERNGLIRIFPMCSSSLDNEQHLLNVRVKSEDVRERWPATRTSQPVQPTTVGQEKLCRRWLAAMMAQAPTQPKPKASTLEEALAKFPALSKRGFDRAWDSAIRETNAEKWRAPGRRS